MDYIAKIQKFVEAEHKKPGSHYGEEPYQYHVIPTVKYAKQLAQIYKADVEIVELAAWLHDIGSARHGRKDHHNTGAQIAEEKLSELGYPKEKIKLIRDCIYNHRGSTNHSRETIEEKIVSEADTLSNFDNISGIFKAAFIYEGLDQGVAQKNTLEKLERKWESLHFKESKEIIRPKYEAVKVLLASD